MSILTSQDIIKTKIEEDELNNLKINYDAVKHLIHQKKNSIKLKKKNIIVFSKKLLKK